LKKIIDDYSFIHFLYDVPECRIKMKPVAQRLHDIHAPTLVIVGERDSPDFHIIADLLIRDIPQARKLIISRVKHMSNMEDPETFNQEVLSFLASPSTTSQSQ
jgi:pimeloyl-ACP methyl ester carboxylesterase